MKLEYAIQSQAANGHWRLLNGHYPSQDAAQHQIDMQDAAGPYPSGAPLEPRRVVAREVATTWKPVGSV